MKSNGYAVTVLVGLVAMSMLVAPAAAATDGSIDADPATSGETATHTVSTTVEMAATGDWTGFTVDYGSSGVDVSHVDRMSLTTVGIDRGDDATGSTVDVDVSEAVTDVSASEDGRSLTLSLDGRYSLSADDEVVVVYGNVHHPEMGGNWDVTLDLTPMQEGGETTATLSVGDSMNDGSMDENSTTSESMNDDSMTTETMEDESMTTESMSEDSMTTQSTDEESMGEDSMTTESMTEGAMSGDSMTTESMDDESMTEESMDEDGTTSESAADSDDGSDSSSSTGPGFTAVLAVIALLGVALYAARRRA